jgi:hypothetical protein
MKDYLYGKPLITPYNPEIDVLIDVTIQKLLSYTNWRSEEEKRGAKTFIEEYYVIVEEDGEIKIKNK